MGQAAREVTPQSRVRAIGSLEARRPRIVVPADERHEFLKDWLADTDPVLLAWEAWFCLTEVSYRKRVLHGRAMLYVHRLYATNSPRAWSDVRWCCE